MAWDAMIGRVNVLLLLEMWLVDKHGDERSIWWSCLLAVGG